jgi:tetratricopeptide (TPR) repeat protein
MYERATWDDLLDAVIVADIAEQFDLALEYDPTDGNAHFYRGRTLQRTDLPETAKAYRTALESYPALAWLWQDLAEVESELNRFAEAKRAIDIAIGIDPEKLSYYDDRADYTSDMGEPRADVALEWAAGYRLAAPEILRSGDTEGAHNALGGSAGILLVLAEAEADADISAALDRTLNVGVEIGLEPDLLFNHAAVWLGEEGREMTAVAAFDSAVARNPYLLAHWQDRFSMEVDDDRDLVASALKAGRGIMAIGDRQVADGESNAAVFTYWRATVYFVAAQVFGEEDEEESADSPPGDDVRAAVQKMFDAEVDYLGGEVEMIVFFREWVEPGGGIEEQLSEGGLRERLRFVIGLLVEERAAATG